ncbi:MAG TPA: fibronectin type III domain-containing protein [Cyclobacteriaceae bacterium]|nr:fibronectin type III domain-containing protein [Cyclobacteriaceae bacterium]
MKKLYLWIVLSIIYSTAYSQCETITLQSQAEVDAFPSTYGCSSVSGILFISGQDITHLDSLYSLQSVGNLRVYVNPNLTSLHGLEGLTTAGALEITANALLVDLTGLNNVEVVGGTLEIASNNSLTSLRGLDKLRHVNNVTHIGTNPSLTTLDGMDHLEHPGSLEIVENQVLTDLKALSVVTATSNLTIWKNDALTSLNGLHNITRLWALYVRLNKSLTNLDELAALDSITMDIAIDRNPALASIAGLNGIRYLNDLAISDNGALTNIDGLNTIVSVRDLVLNSNPVLENIDGLSGLKSMRSIRIYNSPALVDIDGLSSVDSVSGTIYISTNPLLQNLNGLSGISGHIANITVANNPLIQNVDAFNAITSVGGEGPTYENGISIYTNHGLQNLDGLNAITKVQGPLVFQSNPGVKDLGLSSLKEIDGEVYINSNSGLLSLNSLRGVEKISGKVEISYNGALSSLDGLSSLQSVGGSFVIQSNDSLENIRGLGKLKSIGMGLNIYGNGNLRSLEGLDSLSSLGADPDPSFRSLSIQENNSLETIGNMRSLKSLPGMLFIGYNPVLHDLDGLDSLKSMSGTTVGLIITNNAMLNNIDALSQLTTISGTTVKVQLTNNTSLARCCGLYPLIHGGGVSGTGGVTYIISGNAAGCTREDIDAGGRCDGSTTNEQPTALTFTAVADKSMRISFTPPANAPDGYITLMRDNAPPHRDDVPVDGSTYTVGQKVGLSTVVTYGDQTAADITGLVPNTTYYFEVYAFTEGYNGGQGNDYVTVGPLAGSQATGATPGEGVMFSNVTASSMTVSFGADASNPEGYLVLMRAFGSSYPDDVPVDGTSYSVGQTIGSSTIVVGVGSQTSHNVIYLGAGTPYYFDVYKYTAGYDYVTEEHLSGNQQTLTEDPQTPGDTLAQPSNIVFANVTDNSMTVSFTASSGEPDGYIALMRAFGSPSPEDVPVDGMTYHVGNVIGSSTIVVGIGSSTSLDVVYLEPNTEYYFDIYSFNNTSEGVDYLTPGPLQGHQRTEAFASMMASKSAPFPNPFVDSISIPFTTTEDDTFVKVMVHDQSGRKVAEITSDSFSAGYHEVQWDRRDHQGNRMGNGMYVYNIVSSGKNGSASGVIVAK